jgi:hypothetical protein
MRREERKNESILTGTHEHLEDLRYFFSRIQVGISNPQMM